MKYIIAALLAFFIALVAIDILNHDKGWFGWGERPNDWRDDVLSWGWRFEP